MILHIAKKPMTKRDICNKLDVCEGTISVQLSQLCSSQKVRFKIDPTNYKRKLYVIDRPLSNVGQVTLGVFING